MTEYRELVERLKHRGETKCGMVPVGASDGDTYLLGYYDNQCAADDIEAATALTTLMERVEKLEAEVRALRATYKTINDAANHGVNNADEALADIYRLTTAALAASTALQDQKQ